MDDDLDERDDLCVMHALSLILLEKVGGSLSFDHEDLARFMGKNLEWKSENGTLHVKIVG